MEDSTIIITREEFLARQVGARQRAEGLGLDALLVVGRSFYDRPGDIAYLTNHFPPFPTAVFDDVSRGFGHAILLLPVAGAPVLLTDLRGHRTDLIVVDDARPVEDLGMATIDLLRERGLDRSRIGLVGDDILPAAIWSLWTADLPGLSIESANHSVRDLRSIKSVSELQLLRAAASCADAAIAAAVREVREGNATERSVGAAGGEAALAHGADFIRYLRVHSGPWAAMGSRWPPATDRAILPAEIVVLDAIGAVNGYAFDMNRTLATPGISQEQRALLDIGERATMAAVDACRSGVSVDAVVVAADQVIADSPFASGFSGNAGHAIGIETVELPYIRRGDQTMLRPGMVLCVEPSLSIAGLGGVAIEQTVIIRPEGPPEVITRSPTRLWNEE